MAEKNNPTRADLLRRRVRTRLAHLGANGADLARAMGIARSTLQGRLAGRDAKLSTIEGLAAALAVPTAYLLDPAESTGALTAPAPAWAAPCGEGIPAVLTPGAEPGRRRE